MRTLKYIYWRPDLEEKSNDGKMLAYVHFLTNENQGTLRDYQHMADHFRKSFPEATDDKIHCSKIVKSSTVKGYSILIWNARIKIQNYPNWLERDFSDIEYLWR